MQQPWPEDKETAWAKIGVAPVGTRELHEASRSVFTIDEDVHALAKQMIRIMERADGIGLAANQVAVPRRLLVHALPKVAPSVLVNPDLLATEGQWTYREGCLSLQIEGTRVEVQRPKRILLRAQLLSGALVVIWADELLGRVLQHEIDHLNGIEYVQRLTGRTRKSVYAALRHAGVNLKDLPSRPYTFTC